LRLGEALSLEWQQVNLEPAQGAKFGYLTVLSGKAKSKKSRNVPVALAEQSSRPAALTSQNSSQDGRRLRAALVAAHVRDAVGRVRGRCLHYNEADGAFHSYGLSTVRSSSPEAVELAYERMTVMNLRRLPTNSPTASRDDLAVAL
jgi:hypothetical protein